MSEIADVYSFRDAYYEKQPDGHYFDTDTLKFFGESMSGMRLLKGTEMVTSLAGVQHTCYVVSSTQRLPMSGRRKRVYHYFDVNTLEDICV